MTTEITRCPSCGEECFLVRGVESWEPSAFVGMGRERKCLEFHADYRRVVEWIKNPKRKPANLAFTESPERQIAYAVEEQMGDWKDGYSLAVSHASALVRSYLAPQALQLKAGEMTAQEIRAVKAVLNAIIAGLESLRGAR